MVHIIDGNSEHVAHEKRSLLKKKIRFVNALDLNKLPSNLSTISKTDTVEQAKIHEKYKRIKIALNLFPKD